jgi:predicted acylesterase/phospholipase RssA
MKTQPLGQGLPQPDTLSDPLTYAAPDRFCDLVMKGGITSGVAYPRAVCELARDYSFKNIGGASAGAIAAAAAAAAEYHRRVDAPARGDESGYARLAKLPGWLAEDGNLAHLFQANPPTAPLYRLLTRALKIEGGALRKTLALLFAAWRSFTAWGLAGAALGLLLVLPLVVGAVLLASSVDATTAPQANAARTLLFGYGGLFALVFVAVVGSVLVIVGLARRASRGLAENFYGLTTGLLDPEGGGERAVLTTWLADEIDGIAGRPPRTAPLTFGDLWGAVGKLDEQLPEGDDRGLRLQIMTTNLTLGKPYRLPFDDDSTEYFYDPDEWARFFPAYVMKWLADHPRQPTETAPKAREEQEARWRSHAPRLPLPAPEHIPVVVAARMSLSFPVLISAVPLWTVDWSLVGKDEKTGEVRPPRLERCVFSDGGASSNFPIHFFDRALPRWPTFGIDLQSFPPNHPRDEDEGKNSYLVNSNRGGILDAWDRFDDPRRPAAARVTGFLTALVNTMYNWADNAQMRVPGYRDRVVHIFQAEDEGGLNLDMPPRLILAMAERGRLAGVKLRERFMGRDDSDLTWDNHRWIRYRSVMSLVENLLRDLRRAAQPPLAGEAPYETLIARSKTDPPPSYRLDEPKQRDYAALLTRRLLELADEWERERERTGQSFAKDAPRPAPELRIRPRI